MARRSVLGVVVCALALAVSGCVAAPTPVALTFPSATAFSILGHSCGGIHQQVLATGFDPNGQPAGVVFLQTRCSTGGRGGNTVTYTAWAAVTWDLSATVTSSTKLATAPTNIDPNLSVSDGKGDILANSLTAVNVTPANCSVGNVTYCTYRATLTVPVPGAPSGVTVGQSQDSLDVHWTAPSVGGPAITSSTVTAVPVGGGTTLTATATGAGTAALVAGVAPSTTYTVTVTSSSISGTGPASAPVTFTTHDATTVPSAPGALAASWNGSSTALVVSWTAPLPGDSPIDGYQVEVAQSDPTGPPTAIDVGLATSASIPGYDSTLDWSVRARAHNAAGWGAWSASAVVPAAN